jgi:predicted DNA-binding WGR domain protein
MDNLLTVTLEARNPERNHHRRYQIILGRDLLDAWTVAIRYGRIGQGGQEWRQGSARPEEIRAVIRDRLRRRLSAPKRIGCPYRLTRLDVAPGFSAWEWLPGEVMARFCADGPRSYPVESFGFLPSGGDWESHMSR